MIFVILLLASMAIGSSIAAPSPFIAGAYEPASGSSASEIQPETELATIRKRETKENTIDTDVQVAIDAIMSNPALPPGVKDAFDLILKDEDGLGGIPLAALQAIGDGVKPGFDMVMEFIKNMKEGLSGAKDLPGELTGEVGKGLDTIMEYMGPAKEALEALIAPALSMLDQTGDMGAEVKKFTDFMVTGCESLVTAVGKTFALKFSPAAGILKTNLGKFIEIMTSGGDKMKNAFQDVVQLHQGTDLTFLDGLRTCLGFVTPAIHPMISIVVTTLMSFTSILGAPIKAILGGVCPIAGGIPFLGDL